MYEIFIVMKLDCYNYIGHVQNKSRNIYKLQNYRYIMPDQFDTI